MRRRIQLYLGGQAADLPDDALVLFNWATTDASNPTIVKNSFSQSFNLPRTPRNEAIFGHSGRLDRTAGSGGTGAAFNASRKLPFTLYLDTGEILESGYAKLDSVTDDALSVSLYGGLGEFIYNLSYNSAGEKRTLASLDFGGGDAELDFTITKEAVSDAWQMLKNGSVVISANNSSNYQNLYTDGHIGTSSNAARYVNTYSVDGGRKYLISCRKTATTGTCPAVAYDNNGNVLQAWHTTGSNYSVTDEEVTMPQGAVSLKLQGLTGTQDAGLKGIFPIWDVINFAPCYNGIPSDFNADKALIDTDLLGIVPPVTIDGKSCDAAKGGGYALLTMPEPMDEWQVHDLRSYLQRPVVSVRKILAAIADSNNNGGWSVDLTDLASLSLLDTWLTRPLLPSLGTYKQGSVGASISLAATGVTTSVSVGRFDLSDVPAGSEISARLSFYPAFDVSGAGLPTTLSPFAANTSHTFSLLLFIQAVAYASDNTPVAYGNVKTFFRDDTAAAADLAAYVGFTPQGGAGFDGIQRDHGYKTNGTYYVRQAPVSLEISGTDIAYITIRQTAYLVGYYNATGTAFYKLGDGTKPFQGLFTDSTDIASSVVPDGALLSSGSGNVTGTSAATLRSGAHITKQMLLSTAHTPAEYLLALCKCFGLLMLTDTAAKKVTILRRKSFYVDETIDLTDRIDTTKGMEITPLSFDAKWYDFALESVGGRFEKQYEATDGVQYGIQRVDTGYDFDAETKDLLQGVALKSCAAVQDRGAWWTYAYDAGAVRMWVGPALNAGCTYTLWDNDGGNHEAPASAPTDAATAIPYNPAFPGYDVGVRAEFRDADGKPLDGAECLLWYTGDATPDDFNLTDDTAAMDTLTGGPCWLVESNNVGLTIPEFSRYRIATDAVTESLDFGAPRQVDIPGLDYPDGVTVYDRGWKAYIGDRLSVHSKVMKCRVRLDGLQEGPELLRRFWWYRGTLWVLNKIGNCSLTTFDPAECEFVQVRDKDNYIDNQY